MADGLDMRAVMDPEEVRDPLLVAVLVLRTLMERKDLPVLTWRVESRAVADVKTGGVRQVAVLDGNAYRGRTYNSADGQLVEVEDRDALVRDVIRRWATAFDAEIKVTPVGNSVAVSCEFAYAGVHVDVGATVKTWGDER